MTSASTQLVDQLKLARAPVAIAFCNDVPAGMKKVDSPALSGCTYWKYATEGRSFYTEASDHFGCPVGSYTHGIDLPPEKQQELQGLIGTMVELTYIDPAEIPDIPRRTDAFRYAVYAPLADAEFEPDVVMISGNARQMMILAEAAHAAGVDCQTSMVGRPTCAAIPAVMQSGRTAANLGCIGNRVYTDLPDDELYFAVSGAALRKLLPKLTAIAKANTELEKFHKSRFNTNPTR